MMMHGFVQYLIDFKHDGVDHVVDDQLEVGMSEPLSNVLLSAYNTMMRDQIGIVSLLCIVVYCGVSKDSTIGCLLSIVILFCSTL